VADAKRQQIATRRAVLSGLEVGLESHGGWCIPSNGCHASYRFSNYAATDGTQPLASFVFTVARCGPEYANLGQADVA